jgi:hypothetical protein
MFFLYVYQQLIVFSLLIKPSQNHHRKITPVSPFHSPEAYPVLQDPSKSCTTPAKNGSLLGIPSTMGDDNPSESRSYI